MQGEYRGDFTRDTFDPFKHYSRVLIQQGRVQLDADAHEQVSILLHYLRTLAIDLIGPQGGPGDSFQIKDRDASNSPLGFDFLIERGHYYVDGILCENDSPLRYTGQDDYPLLDDRKLENLAKNNPGKRLLVYLDVWERHITYIEDDHIREVALGGPDTATRAQVVWQARVLPILSEPGPLANIEQILANLEQALQAVPQPGATVASQEQFASRILALRAAIEANRAQVAKEMIEAFLMNLAEPGAARLRARAHVAQIPDDPCTIPPEARFRGAENKLYRVEIHRGGQAVQATFKFSRENSTVSFPIHELAGSVVTLEHLGRDSRFGLAVGDWVEIVDDDYVLQGEDEPLWQVDKIDPIAMQVTLKGATATQPAPQFGGNQMKHPLLRRWDHKAGDPNRGGLQLSDDGAAVIKEYDDDTNWLVLEDGVQIQFRKPATGTAEYRTGDYWLIPARTATGDVEWPKDAQGKSVALPPHGVQHHYAPLAIISVDALGKVTPGSDCRHISRYDLPLPT